MTYEFCGRKVSTPLGLNGGQKAALEAVAEFATGDGECMTLMGFAGTGKTTLMGIVRDMLQFEMPLQFSATTHKAAGVLKSRVGGSVSTVNSLFGIIVEQDLDADRYDVSVKRRREGDDRLVRGSLVVIDEASMLSEENFRDVMGRCREHGCKVLFVGDPAQLAPVGEDDVSVVFRQDAGRTVSLTEVERTDDGGILAEATAVRNGAELSMEDSGGVTFIGSGEGERVAAVLDRNIPGLRDDPNWFRVLSFTNRNVGAVNTAVRRRLGFGDGGPREGEPMMSYANWGYDWRRKRTGTPYRFVNSEGYQVVGVGEPYVADVSGYVEPERWSGGELPLTAVPLTLKDALGQTVTVPYMDVKGNPDNMRAARLLAHQKQLLWGRWRTAPLKAKQGYLTRINEIDEMLFTNDSIRDADGSLLQAKVIDYGYAHTIHKSQGSTFTNVLVNDTDICICPDSRTRRQLRYVAITRASRHVDIIVHK